MHELTFFVVYRVVMYLGHKQQQIEHIYYNTVSQNLLLNTFLQ